MENINNLWAMACYGSIESLMVYYRNDGKRNLRYNRFGKDHSLIMGALRNREYETVAFLLSVGETVEPHEMVEFQETYINRFKRKE